MKNNLDTMKKIIASSVCTLLLMFVSACSKSVHSDATGTFEATEEIIVSAEVAGVVKKIDITEGQLIKAGDVVGYIDSVQLALKKKQLESQIEATLSRRPDIRVQLASLQEQLATAEREQKRVDNLFKADAATKKQLDDANAQVEVITKQIYAQKSSLEITSNGITKEAMPLWAQVEQVDDQLKRSRIVNPIDGLVLLRYIDPNEMATVGKSLYKIANLETLVLRAYITGSQFSKVQLGQKVRVWTDDGNGGFKSAEGVLTWISSKAEFTPKSIQTKDERANLVYAIKVLVKNDGFYKIGMYGEVELNPQD